MANSYIAGTLVRVATYTGTVEAPVGGFRDLNGNLADPPVVTLTYRTREGGPLIVVTYPDARIVRDDTGLYHSDLDTTGAFATEWAYAWTGIGGSAQVVAENYFNVRPVFS